MKKKRIKEKRLALDKETVRLLTEPRMAEVYGGLWTCGCTDVCSQAEGCSQQGCYPYSAGGGIGPCIP